MKNQKPFYRDELLVLRSLVRESEDGDSATEILSVDTSEVFKEAPDMERALKKRLGV